MTTEYFDAIAGHARSLITHIGLVDAHGRELSGAGYQRQAVTWTSPAQGEIAPTKDLVFTVPPNSTVAEWRGYSARSGGTDYGGEAVPVETFRSAGQCVLQASGTGIVHRAGRV